MAAAVVEGTVLPLASRHLQPNSQANPKGPIAEKADAGPIALDFAARAGPAGEPANRHRTRLICWSVTCSAGSEFDPAIS